MSLRDSIIREVQAKRTHPLEKPGFLGYMGGQVPQAKDAPPYYRVAADKELAIFRVTMELEELPSDPAEREHALRQTIKGISLQEQNGFLLYPKLFERIQNWLHLSKGLWSSYGMNEYVMRELGQCIYDALAESFSAIVGQHISPGADTIALKRERMTYRIDMVMCGLVASAVFFNTNARSMRGRITVSPRQMMLIVRALRVFIEHECRPCLVDADEPPRVQCWRAGEHSQYDVSSIGLWISVREDGHVEFGGNTTVLRYEVPVAHVNRESPSAEVIEVTVFWDTYSNLAYVDRGNAPCLAAIHPINVVEVDENDEQVATTPLCTLMRVTPLDQYGNENYLVEVGGTMHAFRPSDIMYYRCAFHILQRAARTIAQARGARWSIPMGVRVPILFGHGLVPYYPVPGPAFDLYSQVLQGRHPNGDPIAPQMYESFFDFLQKVRNGLPRMTLPGI